MAAAHVREAEIRALMEFALNNSNNLSQIASNAPLCGPELLATPFALTGTVQPQKKRQRQHQPPVLELLAAVPQPADVGTLPIYQSTTPTLPTASTRLYERMQSLKSHSEGLHLAEGGSHESHSWVQSLEAKMRPDAAVMKEKAENSRARSRATIASMKVEIAKMQVDREQLLQLLQKQKLELQLYQAIVQEMMGVMMTKQSSLPDEAAEAANDVA